MPAGKIVLARKAKRTYRKRAPRVATVTLAKSKPSKMLTKAVRKEVINQSETKQAFTTTGNSLIKYNSGIDAVGDLTQIIPGISQGFGENQRVGNIIRLKSLNVRGYVKLDVNEVTDSTKLPNVMVRMMIVSMKVAPSFQDAQSLSSKIGTLLMKGSTTTAFAGNLQDIFAPINRNVFTVHADKRFYLKQDYLNVAGASAPSTTIAQDISKTVKFFNITIKGKNKVIRYDEDVGSDILPTNFGPFLLLGYSYLDGSSPDVLDTKVGLCFDSTLNFTDA